MKTRNTRKVLSALLALLMALALIPAAGVVTASAATGTASINIGTLGATNQDNSGNPTESYWYYSSAGKMLTLRTEDGNYSLTGTNADLHVQVIEANVNVTLDNVNITFNSSSAYSTVFGGNNLSDGCTLTLVGNNILTGVSAATNANGLFYVNGTNINWTVTSSSGGTLTTTGGANGFGLSVRVPATSTLSIAGNAVVTAVGGAGQAGVNATAGNNNLLIGDNAKLIITNNSASPETHTFTKANATTTHKWKLTPASILSSGALTDASIGVTIPAGATVTIAREAIPVAPAITTTTLPGGTVGTAYNQTLAATGTSPITWSISAGALPTGLTLNTATGAITGTPTAAGTANFTVKAANGVTPDATKALSIVISKAPRGIFGTNPRWTAWWAYLLFFLCFGFIWMWF